MIPTVTKPFCGDCDRVRLTADGQFRTCLFATDEFDLRAAMRAGETDDELAARIERAVGTKWAGHQINQVNFIRPTRIDEPDRRLMRRCVAGRGGGRSRRSPPPASRPRRSRPSIGPATVGRQAARVDARPARRSAAARSSRPTTRGTRTSARLPLHPRQRADHRPDPGRSAATTCTPTSARTPTTASRSSSCRRSSRSCRSRTRRTATRAIRARSRSRSTRRSRVAAASGDRHVLVLRQGTCELFELFVGHPHRCRLGRRRPAPASTSRRTPCARSAGRAPTPPDCRSCPGSCATTRSRPARSATRSGSRSRETQRGYILPATHFASRLDRSQPARRWGMRLRLKASFDIVAAHRPGAGDRRGDAALRVDRRRQRHRTGSSRAPRARAGTTTTSNQLKSIPGIGLRGGRHRPGASR